MAEWWEKDFSDSQLDRLGAVMELDESSIRFDSTKLERVGSAAADVTAQSGQAKSGFMPYFVDGADAYGNRGMSVGFKHVPSGRTLYFKAFIAAFNETYSSDWNSEVLYGRADPVMLFKNTTRTMNITLLVPAASQSEAYENLAKVGTLAKFLYPVYVDVNDATTIGQSPLCRLSVMNLAQDNSLLDGRAYGKYGELLSSAELGLLGAITSLSINHNLDSDEAGVLEVGDGVILPKLIEIALDFAIIHEHALGWDEQGNFSNAAFPYGQDMAGSKSGDALSNAQKQVMQAGVYNAIEEAKKAEERGDEEPNNNLKANAAARFQGALEGIGVGIWRAKHLGQNIKSRASGARTSMAMNRAIRADRRADSAAAEDALSLRDRPDIDPDLSDPGLTEEGDTSSATLIYEE